MGRTFLKKGTFFFFASVSKLLEEAAFKSSKFKKQRDVFR
jgi:hypothetical protein